MSHTIWDHMIGELKFPICTIKGHLVYSDSWILSMEDNSKIVHCERCLRQLKVTPDKDDKGYEWVEEYD